MTTGRSWIKKQKWCYKCHSMLHLLKGANFLVLKQMTTFLGLRIIHNR
jgi:hypothetical protein